MLVYKISSIIVQFTSYYLICILDHQLLIVSVILPFKQTFLYHISTLHIAIPNITCMETKSFEI